MQSVLIENFLLANFLGMCTYLACSNKLSTANGLGLAVVIVITASGMLNWFVHQFITGDNALSWLSHLGLDASKINLKFLEFLIFISSLPLCSGIRDCNRKVLTSFIRIFRHVLAFDHSELRYSWSPPFCGYARVSWHSISSLRIWLGVGWWLAIALIAAIREKLRTSKVPFGLEGMGITFIMTGLMSMAFMGFTGIKLANPTGGSETALEFQQQGPGK